MFRRALLCLGLIGLGCRTTGTPAAARQLVVETLQVSFPSASRGQLELGLTVQGSGQAVQVQWQLWLDGQPLSSGVQALGQQLNEYEPTKLTLRAPLLTAHALRDEGWRTVTLEVSGELTVKRILEERMHFVTRRQLLIHGAPKF